MECRFPIQFPKVMKKYEHEQSICGASARDILGNARIGSGNYSWGFERAR